MNKTVWKKAPTMVPTMAAMKAQNLAGKKAPTMVEMMVLRKAEMIRRESN